MLCCNKRTGALFGRRSYSLVLYPHQRTSPSSKLHGRVFEAGGTEHGQWGYGSLCRAFCPRTIKSFRAERSRPLYPVAVQRAPRLCSRLSQVRGSWLAGHFWRCSSASSALLRGKCGDRFILNSNYLATRTPYIKGILDQIFPIRVHGTLVHLN